MKKTFVIIIILAIIGWGTYVFLTAPKSVLNIPTYEYTETYTNQAHSFSFKYPKGFRVTAVPDTEGSGEIILVENGEDKVGLQIMISPFPDGEMDIIPEIIKQDIPDISVERTEVVHIDATRKGLSFLSNNESFGGASSETWFVFKGNSYQMSSYESQDALVRGVFDTWKFN